MSASRHSVFSLKAAADPSSVDCVPDSALTIPATVPEGKSYLLVVGEREALGWILREQRMAFRDSPRALRHATGVTPGTELLIYTSRNCFHNPGRDRGRVIAAALATSRATVLNPPLSFAGAEFSMGCALSIRHLAPFGDGIDLGAMVDSLPTFPRAWAIHLRRTLVPLSPADALTLRAALAGVAQPLDQALPTYLPRIARVRNR